MMMRPLTGLVGISCLLGLLLGLACALGCSRGASGRPPVGAVLDEAAVRGLPAAARAALEQRPGPAPEDRGPAGPRWVAISVARERSSALVGTAVGEDLSAALRRAAVDLRQKAGTAALVGRVKVDVLTNLEKPVALGSGSRVEIEPGLDGLVFATGTLWLLPEEIHSRGLVKSDGEVRWSRIASYLEETGRTATKLVEKAAGKPYARARFASAVESGEGAGAVLFRGNRLVPPTDAESLLAAARAAGDHLLRHQREDGSFHYIYRAERDKVETSYNELRHAGTSYALFELHAATGDPRYFEAGNRAVRWLLSQRLQGPRAEDAAADFDTIVSDDPEAKLGGAALALLAMAKRVEVGGDASLLETMRGLARFIAFQQEPDGRFRSKYYYGKAPAREFESIYYPGEAILALARLHRLDGDRRWLEVARKGADWLIDRRDAGKGIAELPHDHWLLMGLEELIPLTGDARYLAQARRIAEAITTSERLNPEPPDWVGSFYIPPRATPAATRSEALVAMARLAARQGIDPKPYLESLERMIRFQLRCQVTPENAFYVPRPDQALGGFRRSLTVWELRIDYAQHNLSSLLGYRGLLTAVAR